MLTNRQAKNTYGEIQVFKGKNRLTGQVFDIYPTSVKQKLDPIPISAENTFP